MDAVTETKANKTCQPTGDDVCVAFMGYCAGGCTWSLGSQMDLPEINTALEVLTDPTRACIEIKGTGSKKQEVTIFANRDGLVLLAAYCLDLAERQVDGSHYHFDQMTVDSSELPLVVTFREGPNQLPVRGSFSSNE